LYHITINGTIIVLTLINYFVSVDYL